MHTLGEAKHALPRRGPRDQRRRCGRIPINRAPALVAATAKSGQVAGIRSDPKATTELRTSAVAMARAARECRPAMVKAASTDSRPDRAQTDLLDRIDQSDLESPA